MDAIRSFLGQVKSARRQEHKNLALYPLLAPPQPEPNYLVLPDALEQGLVQVTEIDDSGSVPELRLVNQASKPVLMVEGEELVGAKQNRIVNVTILVAAMSELVIPVSCVEQGRWGYRSESFSSARRMMTPGMKREHVRQTGESLRSGRGFQSDQFGIWEQLHEAQARMQAPSETGAMSDLFERYEDPLGAYLDAFRLIDCQVGAVFFLHGRLAGLECFGHDKTFAAYFEGLVKSYALDAMDRPGGPFNARPNSRAVQTFLNSVAGCKRGEYEAPGLGESIRLEGMRVAGSALVESERLLHLSAFYLPEQNVNRNLQNISRFSERRRRNVH